MARRGISLLAFAFAAILATRSTATELLVTAPKTAIEAAVSNNAGLVKTDTIPLPPKVRMGRLTVEFLRVSGVESGSITEGLRLRIPGCCRPIYTDTAYIDATEIRGIVNAARDLSAAHARTGKATPATSLTSRGDVSFGFSKGGQFFVGHLQPGQAADSNPMLNEQKAVQFMDAKGFSAFIDLLENAVALTTSPLAVE